jgi:citrate lyase subunit beta/citryl-CoA lyase
MADPRERPRRSVHFVPGGQRKLLERSLASAADSLVIDLEDSVPPERKAAARAEARQWLAEVDFGAHERVVRINGLDTEWWRDDLEATLPAAPDAYVIPKVRGGADLERVAAVLDALEARAQPRRALGAVPLLPIATETAEGLLHIREIAAAPRVCALTWGAEDLATDLGARANRDAAGHYLEVFRYARVMTLLAARAAGVPAIDGVYTSFRDRDGLRAEAEQAAQLGFSGKLTIHPDQIEIVNQVFSPSAEEIRESQELLDAWEQERRAGRMAFAFRGRMVDAPHLARARALLERARQLGLIARDAGRR